MAEKKIQEALLQNTGTAARIETYSHIELTEEETAAALLVARRKKAAHLHEQAYIESLKPKVYPLLTAEEFGQWVLSRIKTLIPGFLIDDNNRKEFELLCYYFTGDLRYAEAGFDRNKGIALQGPIGCGKTTLLRAFNVNPTNSYVMVSCRTVADEYSNKELGGDPLITRYSTLKEVPKNDFWGQNQVGRAFDDLGTENVSRHFGNQKNVMEEILQNRYDSLALRGKTHITTNLSWDQITEFYGSRVKDRCKEMFNFHTFSINTPSRRR